MSNNSTAALCIIIPHYNSPRFLDKLLDSIGKRDEVEVIVVDDCSTEDLDLLEEVKTKHCSERVRIITNPLGNTGPGPARNVALEMSKSKWVMFSDADDYFVDGWFDIVSEYLNSDVDVVFFPPDSIDLATGKKPTPRGKLYANLCYNYEKEGGKLALLQRGGTPWSKLISRALIDKHELTFEPVRNWEDVMFVARMCAFAENIVVDKRSVYCVTDTSDSLSRTTAKEMFDHRVQVSCRRSKFWRELGYVTTFADRVAFGNLRYASDHFGKAVVNEYMALYEEAGLPVGKFKRMLAKRALKLAIKKLIGMR